MKSNERNYDFQKENDERLYFLKERNHFSLPRLPLDYEGIFISDEESGLERDSKEVGAGLNSSARCNDRNQCKNAFIFYSRCEENITVSFSSVSYTR